MDTWSRQELQQAHDRYVAVANACAQAGEWSAWADLFTEDASYVEHHYGTFTGREAIGEWITATMAQWPNSQMRSFPHDWCVCDEERGRWICQIENRFDDPGDGGVYQESNITILTYAGDGRFSSEEDVYNPARFAAVVQAWMEARRSVRGVVPEPRRGA
jgi:SnoaL-like domain